MIGRRGEEATQDADPYRLPASVRLEAAQAGRAPKTEEEQKTKIKDLVAKMTEAQKNNPAVTMPKAEDIQAVSSRSRRKLIRRLQKRAGGAAPGSPGLGGPAPGVGQPGVPNGGVRPPGP